MNASEVDRMNRDYENRRRQRKRNGRVQFDPEGTKALFRTLAEAFKAPSVGKRTKKHLAAPGKPKAKSNLKTVQDKQKLKE